MALEELLAGSPDYPATEEDAAEAGDLMSSASPLATAFDTPGARQALETLVRSSQQARAALQEARAKIAARKYNPAAALLAVSGALGQPTRSGSSAEGWANAANALVNPLREKEQMAVARDKELLGIDTSLAGLDERTAMAQLQLEQLRAKLQGDLQKVGSEIVMEDGKPVYRPPWEARGKEAHIKPAASTNVSLNTEKGLYGTMAEKQADKYIQQYEAAENAPAAIERAERIKTALKEGVFTGAGADLKLMLARLANSVGFDYGDEVVNTETMAADLAKGTLDLIGPSKLGGGTGFSNADREFLNQVSGNKIALNEGSIERLMNIHIRAQRKAVEKWNKVYDRLDKDQLTKLGLVRLDLPKDEDEDEDETADTATASPSGTPPTTSAPYGLAPAPWSREPASPPPRAPPQAEAELRANPDLAQDFLEKYDYLPPL